MASASINNSQGVMLPGDTWGDYTNIMFVINQALSKMQTATLVQIVSCTNSGGVSPVGTVDILPLVNQWTRNGVAFPHTTIHDIPYLRVQGGANAIILDPQPGDIGIAVFASRDISTVKTVKAQANPGSWRSYDYSDGLYLGGVLNGVPSQFVQFSSSGIAITSPTGITFNAPTATAENGGTPQALMNDVFYQWFVAEVYPFLVSLGYPGTPIPAGSETTVLKGQ